MLKTISQDKLNDWLSAISQKYELWVPQECDGGCLLSPYRPEAKLDLESMPKLSAKNIVFPQTECMLKYSYKKDTVNPDQVKVSLQTPDTPSKKVVWGIRPCDVAGISFLEKVFLGNGYHDPYFKARRDECVIVALGCSHPQNSCFCTAVGGSPDTCPGADLLMRVIDGGYSVEVLTPKGEELITAELFSEQNKSKAVKQEGAANKMELPFKLESLPKVADNIQKSFESPYWKEATAACISCGICTYICPTCYCFNIADEAHGMSGERIRCWDTCMSSLYTLEASGHNPRREKSQRYRNRINHKFSYLITNNEVLGCTGCGRCIRECPASVDLRQIVSDLLEPE